MDRNRFVHYIFWTDWTELEGRTTTWKLEDAKNRFSALDLAIGVLTGVAVSRGRETSLACGWGRPHLPN